MKIVAFDDIPLAALQGSSRVAGSTRRKQIFTEVAPDGLHVSLGAGDRPEGGDPFITPRHHHAFQQIRWCHAGAKNYAPGQFIPAGSLAYFPRGAYYGPQSKGHSEGFSTQFGFGSEQLIGPEWRPFVTQARANLKARGENTGGWFKETDPQTGDVRQKDAVQAFYEEAVKLRTGEQWAIPPEGYDAPILIHPAAFAYYEVAPGVEVKRLGNFYDHPGENADVRIAMYRISDGGTLTLRADRAQVAITTSDGLQVEDGNISYPVHTSLYSPRGEDVEITSAGATELYVVDYPRLD